jgi:hypothetical protein
LHPADAQPAVIATLGAFAFTLYSVSIRRADRTRRPDQPPAILATALISVAAGTLAAATAWTVTALIHPPPTWHLPGLTTTTITAIAFLLTFATSAIALFRSRSVREQL